MSDPNSAQNSITTSSYSAWLQEQQGGVLVATWYSGESEAQNYLHCEFAYGVVTLLCP